MKPSIASLALAALTPAVPVRSAPVEPAATGAAAALPTTRRDDQDVWTQEELDAVAAEILAQVEKLRGKPFVREVAVKIMDKDGLVQVLLDEFAEDYSEGQLDGIDLSARMLGLLPPGTSYRDATLEFVRDQVGGFYLPGTDTFYLMESYTGGVAKVILSHELTHALDDQHYDLDPAMKARLSSSDAAIAYKAVVEGAATVVMTLWSRQHIMDGGISMDDLTEADLAMTESLESAPRFLWLPLLAPYILGMQFLADSDSLMQATIKVASSFGRGERLPIDEAYANPPRSTEQVLHPEKYWDPLQRDEPRPIEFALEDPPDGWEILFEDVLGELLTSILVSPFDERGGIAATQSAMMAIRYTNDIAAGWGGDRLALLGKGDERFLRLVTLWDTARDAAEFYGAMTTLLPGLKKQLGEVAALEVSRTRARRTTLELAYGQRDDEVVLTMSFGARKGDVADVAAALKHREVGAR